MLVFIAFIGAMIMSNGSIHAAAEFDNGNFEQRLLPTFDKPVPKKIMKIATKVRSDSNFIGAVATVADVSHKEPTQRKDRYVFNLDQGFFALLKPHVAGQQAEELSTTVTVTIKDNRAIVKSALGARAVLVREGHMIERKVHEVEDSGDVTSSFDDIEPRDKLIMADDVLWNMMSDEGIAAFAFDRFARRTSTVHYAHDLIEWMCDRQGSYTYNQTWLKLLPEEAKCTIPSAELSLMQKATKKDPTQSYLLPCADADNMIAMVIHIIDLPQLESTMPELPKKVIHRGWKRKAEQDPETYTW